MANKYTKLILNLSTLHYILLNITNLHIRLTNIKGETVTTNKFIKLVEKGKVDSTKKAKQEKLTGSEATMTSVSYSIASKFSKRIHSNN